MKNAFVYVQPAMITVALLISTTLLAQNTSPYWSLVGNTNATTSSKLGTTNSIPLRLMTNNSTRIYISPSAGYVGIGTSSPSARLHVNAASGTSPLRVQINGSSKLYMSSAGGLSVGSSTAAPSNGLYVAGKVGIGTNAPAAKLHVVGFAQFDSAVFIYNGGLASNTNSGTAISGYSYYSNGLYGNSGSQAGVYGNSSSSTKAGVEGNGSRYGVYGNSSGGYGVFGNSGNYVGVAGSSTNNKGVVGSSTNHYGGYFESYSNTALRATTINGDYAAIFDGTVYSTGGYWTSDRKLKQNIEPFDDALNLIAKLKPRYYEFKTEEQYRFLHLPKGKHYGLIAQDVEALLPNLVSTAAHEILQPMSIQKDEASAIASPDPSAAKRESITIKALNYTELIPIMIKGIQEVNKKLIEENNQLRKEIVEIKQMVIGLNNRNANNSALLSSSYLEQNIPNPAGGSTIIGYHIAENVRSVQLVFTDASGKIVKSIALDKGSGQVSLITQSLAAGSYTYSLLVDGKQVDSKKLLVTR